VSDLAANDEALDLGGDEARLLAFVRCNDQQTGLAQGIGGTEWASVRQGTPQGRGELDDPPGRPEVVVKSEDPRLREIFQEFLNEADVRSAPGEHGLCRIADD